MAQHQVLFCPFCRESFEGLEQCPEHELPLVGLARLRGDEAPDGEHDDDLDGPKVPGDLRPLALFELRHGRGWVALGALCQLAALSLPFGDAGQAIATYQLARAVPSLWTLSLVAITVFYVLARRRTLRALRSLRVLVPGLGAVALACLLWAYGRLGWSVTPALGSYAMVIGAVLLAVGGARLGAD
ncbi:MAG TPA: hypothetical protein VI299_08885 [Polyangiales bacterium]